MSDVVVFPKHPRQLDLGGRRKRLVAPYRYEWISPRNIAHRLTAPRGFTHNGASVPRIVWSFYPPHPLDRAAVAHDLLYQRAGILLPGEHEAFIGGQWRDVGKPWTRHASDRFFKYRLAEDPEGPGWLRRRLAYDAVWLGGRGSWGGDQRAA